MIIGGSPLVGLLNSFRIVWGMGGYGAGKTLNAFQIAHLLYQTGRYRYILSNCNSVWTDSPEDVKLRDGQFVDGIVVLDEGGLFLRSTGDVSEFLIGLRKLNITIVVPSVQPPNSKIKVLQIQRTLNLTAVGLPVWLYEYRLAIGTVKDKSSYALCNPQQMYGIYDTLDYAVDDAYLGDWFEYWMHVSKSNKPAWQTWGPPPAFAGQGDRRRKGKDSDLDNIRGLLEDSIEEAESLSDIISFSSDQKSSKRNKRRI